jgi:hypothetical protein
MSCRRYKISVLLLAGLASSPLSARAQSLSAAAGASTFLNASGFELDYKWAPVTGWLGLGVSDGTRVGGFLGTKYQGFDLGAGDRPIPFVLDTDVFDQSYVYYGRGVSVGRRSDEQQWLLFAGTSASPFSTPFLRAYERGGATGGFFYEGHSSDSAFTYHLYSIVSDQVTAIASLAIKPYPNWKLAWATGFGANKAFESGATDYHYRWVRLTGSCMVNFENFRRFRISNLPYPERTGANARAVLTPLPNLGLELDHETVLSPIFGSQDSLKATLDSASLFTSLDGYRFSASASSSRGGGFLTRTRMLTVNRRLDDRLSVFGAAIRIGTQTTKPANLLLATADEKLTRRFSVRETFTHGQGTKTMAWGGQFLSNPISLGIDYETLFSPLAGAFNGKPFVQAWVVNAQIQLPGGVGLHYGTFIDPFGKFRYTAFLSGIHYNAEGEAPAGPTSAPVNIGHYLIRGVVQDERGNPVWGVAVQVDSTFVYSDNSGQFYVRVSRKEDYPLKIAPGKSLSATEWEIVSAPSTVLAAPEGKVKAVVIVVRRAHRPSSATPKNWETNDPPP